MMAQEHERVMQEHDMNMSLAYPAPAYPDRVRDDDRHVSHKA